MSRWFILAAIGFALAVPARAEELRVVATIPPIHSLVAAVMDGVGRPVLLIKGGASPHTYSIKPTDAKALANAQVVFWIGESLELHLVKPLATLADKAKVVELIDTPGLRLLPYRTGGPWGHDDGDRAHEDRKSTDQTEKADHNHGDTDAHIWLSPANARVLAAAIANALAESDPARADAYRANGRALSERLSALEAEMKAATAPVKSRPFVVFHDAYQYLEDAFGLNAIGAISVNPNKPPGPKAVSALRERIKSTGARCVFREPQFPAKLVDSIAEGTGSVVAVLDPEGLSGTPGPDLYFDLMRANTRSLAGCLSGG